jgi:hypothetical protein
MARLIYRTFWAVEAMIRSPLLKMKTDHILDESWPNERCQSGLESS